MVQTQGLAVGLAIIILDKARPQEFPRLFVRTFTLQVREDV